MWFPIRIRFSILKPIPDSDPDPDSTLKLGKYETNLSARYRVPQ